MNLHCVGITKALCIATENSRTNSLKPVSIIHDILPCEYLDEVACSVYICKCLVFALIICERLMRPDIFHLVLSVKDIGFDVCLYSSGV